MPATNLRIPQLPDHQRALHRAGIHFGLLEVDYQPEPPFFTDQPHRYSFARLTLSRKLDSTGENEEMLVLRFQRHLLRSEDAPSREELSHPRFDYGTRPWTCFYAPMVVPPPLAPSAAHRLMHTAGAARALEALRQNREVAQARRMAASGDCMLVAYLDALASQGVPVEVRHHLDGGVWTEEDLAAAPARFNAGTAARLFMPADTQPALRQA